jgi:hypothetical protein
MTTTAACEGCLPHGSRGVAWHGQGGYFKPPSDKPPTEASGPGHRKPLCPGHFKLLQSAVRVDAPGRPLVPAMSLRAATRVPTTRPPCSVDGHGASGGTSRCVMSLDLSIRPLRTLTKTLHYQVRGLIRSASRNARQPLVPTWKRRISELTCPDGNLDKNPA